MERFTSHAAIVILFAILILSGSVFAAEVTKAKGSGVLIKLDGEAAAPGDRFFLMSADGKKKALVEITKVKNGQALAHVSKGRAEVGQTLQRAGSGGAVAASRSSRNDDSGGSRSNRGQFLRSRSYWGGMLGYGIDAMSVDLNTTPARSTAMSGSAFSALGFFDYELFDRVWFRGAGGYQGFAATSGDSCVGGSCNVNIGYLDLTFLGRYLFAVTAFRPWAGLGFDMLFPLMKSSTALDSSSINNSGVIVIAAGFDWSISPTMYIPVSIEYGMFPKSSTVDAHWITLRAGVAIPF